MNIPMNQVRREDGQALSDSERRFRQFIENAYEMLAIVSPDATIRYAGSGMERLLGRCPDEAVGRNLFDFVHADDLPRISEDLAWMVEKTTGRGTQSEVRLLHQDQSWRWIEVAASNFLHEPAIGGFLINAHDVTSRRLALEDLRRTLDLKEAIFQGSRDAIFISDSSSTFTIVNSAACLLTGFSECELLRMRIPDLHDDVNQQAYRKYHDRIMNGEELVSEAEVRRKDGTKIYAEFNNRRVTISNIPYMHTVARDISERKRAEDALKKSEEQYRLLFERNVAAIFCTTPQGRILDCNDAFVRLLGYDSRDDVLGHNSYDLYFTSEYRDRYVKRLLAERRLTGLELALKRKDGSAINLMGNVSLVPAEPGGDMIIYGTLIDISVLKLSEEKLKEFARKLERSNEELARFAYIASHDLQEPLRKVQAFAGRLKTKYGDLLTGDGQDYLERMVGAASRMQVLITDLLQLSRVTTKGAAFTHTDLGRILREVVSDLEIQIENVAGAVTAGYLPTIEADATQMRQLFQNIIGNALKFHRRDVPPLVNVKYQMEESRNADQEADSPGQVCRILIEDNGIGFDGKHAERIFSPFQRLNGRGEYEGTGIGLAVCKRIIERHGGSISAESVPGIGSSFIVTLPVRQNATSGPE
jgi:two-component system, LuxR family, sensor kinase FixL